MFGAARAAGRPSHTSSSFCAAQLGLVTIGTLGVLIKAQRLGLVPSALSLIEQLRAQGYWFSDAVVAQAIAAADDSR